MGCEYREFWVLTESQCFCLIQIERKLWQLHKEKRELRKSYLDHWQATVSQTGTGRPVDGIISPAVAYTAVPHGLNS